MPCHLPNNTHKSKSERERTRKKPGQERARGGGRRRGKKQARKGEEERSRLQDPMAAGGVFYWLVTIPLRVALGVVLGATAVVAIVVVAFVVFVGYTNLRAWWRSPRKRLLRLGGVTTLRRSLGDRCVVCRGSMEAGEKVRTLSCGHVFHRGGTSKCGHGIDGWLLRDAMSWQCPICRQVPCPVLPWKRPPPSSTAPSSPQTSDEDSEEEEELLLPEQASSSQ